MWGKIDKTEMVLLQIWNKDVCKYKYEIKTCAKYP